MNDYIVYTDGAYSSSKDQGGIGIIVLRDNEVILEYSKMYKSVTNNIMELGAVILALRFIKNSINSLTIVTDSMYVIGCATKGWQRKKNIKLWNEFDKQYNRVKGLCSKIEFKHIKGHSGEKYNEQVDSLARSASQQV